MSQQTEVHAPEDDWTGVIDTKLRRKLQNRLNQRSRRKREAHFKTRGPAAATVQSVAPHVSSGSAVCDLRCSNPQIRDSNSLRAAVVQSTGLEWQVGPQKPGHWNNNTYARDVNDAPETALNQLEEVARRKYMGSPAADLLLTLIQFNVFRALLRNTFTLSLTLDWLKDEALSPICHGRFNASAPPGLQPTLLQRRVEHHPWLDLFPFPAMRDNLLRAYDAYDEDQLCADLVGWCRSPGARTGLIVWGEPWDPWGWEATEAFLGMWGWTIRGCWEILHATNYWRAKRGEEPLLLYDPIFELPAS